MDQRKRSSTPDHEPVPTGRQAPLSPASAPPDKETLASFGQLYAHSPYVAFLLGADGRLLAINPYGSQLLGPAAAPGAPVASLYAPWAASASLNDALDLSRINGCWRGEFDMLDPHGGLLAMSQVIEWRPAGQGVEGDGLFLCLSFDLADYDVFESQLRFKRLFDHHPHPMWVYELDSLRFLVVNQAAVREYGYSEAEFLAMTIEDIRPAEELPRLHDNLANAPRRGGERAGCWTHCRKDGSLIQVEVSSHSVTIAGRAARFVLCHDVTAQLKMEAELYASRELKQLIINQMPHQIFWKDLSARYKGCNSVFARAAGLERNEDVVGKTDDEFPWSHNAVRIRADDREIVSSGQAQLNREEYMDQPDGRRQWFLINKAPLHDRAGRIIGVLGTIEDITERKRAELVMQLQARALDASVNAIAIVSNTPEGDQIDYVNPAFVQLTGYAEDEVRRRSLLLLDGDGDQAQRAALESALCSPHDATILQHLRDKHGQPFWAKLHVAPVHADDDSVSHHVCVLTDMTDTIRYQQQLEHQANYDALTDLPNRNLLADRLEQAIGYAQRYQHAVWVAFIDLDNFKLVNDSLGHQHGDELLRTVAERLRACVRDSDTVARLGGDEFTLLLMETPHTPAAASLLRRVLEAVTAPVVLGSRQHTITCSIGVSVCPQDGVDAQQLLRQADLAMYRAKEAGRNQIQFYEAAMHARVNERTLIEAELRHALERGELSLHFQPKVKLLSGEMTGLEALLRWHHPTLGMVAPTRFIGVAEETGLIVPIGRWVVRAACAQCQAWQAAGLAPQRVAVNLSMRQFSDPGLVDDIIAALDDSGLKPQWLELELTESLMMHNVGAAVEVMTRLKKLGVSLSIDDFGTGYSSLAYLRLFPVDYLKIDQSFVRDMLANPNVAAIVRSIISLAHSLDFKVVAEGVETEAQLAYLRRYQCDEMQGYLFSRPQPADGIASLLGQEAALPQPVRPEQGQRTLLLLDDEPNVLAALNRLLRRDGYTILRANTADEAFALLASHDVQVVVSDQRMPGMQGTEFLRRVKQLYPGTVRIILSGYTELESVLSAINSGEIYRFYTKPWNDTEMRDNIREAFQYHQLIHCQFSPG
ncbi:EAL domain-containing protein [Duganella sp. LX20W]|uniref:EAL domain-containing protein n=1 Tax=Rugamonas brunnea TaxID=2758569 RepID=A0A7W2ENF1_9BURK|nr:EAL domain-containing protein [Rugamonas brunnea]MBA5635601.1 EAL domain-containing protein [Rugamonas brunnea]